MQDLNKIMEFDHVIRVTDYGTTEDGPSNVYAPDSVYVDVDSDGQIVGDAESDMIARLEGEGWTALNGWSSQYLYAGPIMHASESVGGALAGHPGDGRNVVGRPAEEGERPRRRRFVLDS